MVDAISHYKLLLVPLQPWINFTCCSFNTEVLLFCAFLTGARCILLTHYFTNITHTQTPAASFILPHWIMVWNPPSSYFAATYHMLLFTILFLHYFTNITHTHTHTHCCCIIYLTSFDNGMKSSFLLLCCNLPHTFVVLVNLLPLLVTNR